jgi:hypothetical protein
VLVPELVVRHWWENLLHNRRADMLKVILLMRGNRRIVVINIPWYLDRTILERASLKQISPATRPRRVLQAFFLSAVFATLFHPLQLSAQEPAQSAPVSLSANTPVTVQGQVINAATGQPIPRALVRIEGDAETGALTDSDGRFEIPGVPVRPAVDSSHETRLSRSPSHLRIVRRRRCGQPRAQCPGLRADARPGLHARAHLFHSRPDRALHR